MQILAAAVIDGNEIVSIYSIEEDASEIIYRTKNLLDKMHKYRNLYTDIKKGYLVAIHKINKISSIVVCCETVSMKNVCELSADLLDSGSKTTQKYIKERMEYHNNLKANYMSLLNKFNIENNNMLTNLENNPSYFNKINENATMPNIIEKSSDNKEKKRCFTKIINFFCY